jgi:hypothetical protein
LNSNDDVVIVGGQIEESNLHDEQSAVTRRVVKLENSEIRDYAAHRCPFNQMTVMFRVADIIEVGGYKDFYHNEDYYLWYRLIKNEKRLANLDSVLVKVHLDQNSYGRRGGWKYFKSEIKIKRLFLELGLLNYAEYTANIIIRFMIQILLPKSMRQLIFKYLFRS